MARPPDASKVNPVVKEHSLDAINANRRAISSTSPSRPIGIREIMYLSVSGLVFAFISVFSH